MPPPNPRGLLSGDQLDYAQITAQHVSTATTAATATTAITGNEIKLDGNTRIKIEVYAPYWHPADDADESIILYDGSSQVAILAYAGAVVSGSATSSYYPGDLSAAIFLTPSAGSHTYSIRVFGSASGAQLGAGTGTGGTYAPAFMQITRA